MGKDKKKKSKKPEKPKLSNVDDAFYRLTVEDCEKKIIRLKNHLENLDIDNVDIKQKIYALTEGGQVDRAGELTKNLNSLDDTIYKYEEEIYILNKECMDARSRGDATISDLEEKYKAMHDQLTAEIKLLKAKLQMLHEFRVSEDKLIRAIEEEKNLLAEKTQEHKDVVLHLQLRIQHERDLLRKEIETNLLRVSEDFTNSSTMRNAAYAQRLIRENIALAKEVDILALSQESMEKQLKEHIVRCKEVKDTFPALNRKKSELIFVAQEKTNLVEKLTTKYEKLKSAYTYSLLYKNQYRDLVDYKPCKHLQQHQLVTQAKKLASKIHLIKSECHYLQYKYECNEKEKARLKDVIQLVRKTILDAIIDNKSKIKIIHHSEMKFDDDSTEDTNEYSDNLTMSLSECSEEECQYFDLEENMSSKEQRSNLLETLLDILERLKIESTPTLSVESVTPNSFLLGRSDLLTDSSDSLRDSCKYLTKDHFTIASDYLKDKQLIKQESRALIPTERPERCLLFDVEKGSSLYVSEVKSRDREIVVEEEQHAEDMDSESSSYGSQFSAEAEAKPTPTTKAENVLMTEKEETKIEPVTATMPPGTIVDVQMEEEGELTAPEIEDGEATEAVEHDDDELSVYMFY